MIVVCIIYIFIPKEAATSMIPKHQAWLGCSLPHGSLCWLKVHMFPNVWKCVTQLFVSILPISSLVSF